MELFSLFSALCCGIGALVLLLTFIILACIGVGGFVGAIGAWKGVKIVASDNKSKKKEDA